jgi:hypothetical protein
MVIRYWVRRVIVILPPPPEQRTPPKRKHLSADALNALLRLEFDKIADHRGRECPISLTDALMSAFSMFALKDPSLLAFEERRNDENMGNLFGIARVPSDTHMREILDPVEPQAIRPLFNAVFRQLQRGKALEPFVFYQGCYLLSLDGTGYFSSSSIHCDSCLEKVHRQTQETTYQHQMLAAVMIHPDHREVIPFAPEPIAEWGLPNGVRLTFCALQSKAQNVSLTPDSMVTTSQDTAPNKKTQLPGKWLGCERLPGIRTLYFIFSASNPNSFARA